MEILAAALQGLTSADSQVDQAASRIAQASAPSSASSGDTVDLATELVNLEVGKLDYQANLKALQAGDELARHTIDILA